MYESVIKPYWQGNINRFYDTSTDFEGGANYELNSTNLLNKLNKGYTFVDVITMEVLQHGVWKKDSLMLHIQRI